MRLNVMSCNIVFYLFNNDYAQNEGEHAMTGSKLLCYNPCYEKGYV